MKVRSVRANNHKHAFEVGTSRGVLAFPYAKTDPAPRSADPVANVFVDEELGREGFTYILESGDEGSVHVDAVLEYNEDPAYMRDLLVYRLTLEAQRCLENSPLPRREVIRRARTSPAQFYRLLDLSNRRKSVDRLLVLLRALDCEVDFVVRPAATNAPERAGRETRAGSRAGSRA